MYKFIRPSSKPRSEGWSIPALIILVPISEAADSSAPAVCLVLIIAFRWSSLRQGLFMSVSHMPGSKKKQLGSDSPCGVVKQPAMIPDYHFCLRLIVLQGMKINTCDKYREQA